MTRWHIEETRRLIEARFGSPQLRLAKRCLRSVVDRQVHARYHFQEAQRILVEHIDDRLDKHSIYEITWPVDSESWNELNHCLMRVEANFLACAQATHSLGDILAHVVYFATGMNIDPYAIPEREVALARVAEAVDKLSGFKEVSSRLYALSTDANFKTIEAIVNHGKHRGLIDTSLSVETPESARPYVLRFEPFTYGGRSYAEQEVEEVLKPAYEAVSRAVVDAGDALNRSLAT